MTTYTGGLKLSDTGAVYVTLDSSSSVTVSYVTIASGTITDSAPALTITQTWNDGTEAFFGATMNITDTASAAGSRLQRWQIGGTTVAHVGKAGTAGILGVTAITETGASVVGVGASMSIPATATTTAEGFRSNITAANGSGVTYASLVGFRASGLTKSGGGDTVTQYTAFRAESATAAALNVGFQGLLTVSGTARYNLYMSGTAPNYLAGPTGIGVAESLTTNLIVAAGTTGVSSLRIPHGAAPSSPVNGDMWTTTAGLYVRINGSTVGPLS